MVEDDAGDALLVMRALAREGLEDWEVDEAPTLRDALELLSQNSYDLILLDAMLPDASPPRPLREVLANAGETPIVMLSGVIGPEEGRAAVRAGAQDWLTKQGFQPHHLKRALVHSLERQRLRTLEQQVVQTSKLASLGKLAAGIAHEINNPAAYISMNQYIAMTHIATLKQQLADRPECHDALTELHELLTDNQEGLGLIKSLVQDLGAFSRITNDEMERVDLNTLIEQACQLIGATLRKRATLTKTLTPLPAIVVNRNRIIQVILNLLTNAVSAITPGAPSQNRITISTHLDGADNTQECVLWITDTGCGIHPRDLSRIFDPFFTTHRDELSTGLGLTLVAETIRNHGGRVQATSSLGVGTRITVRLPLETGLKTHPSTTNTVSSVRRHILLIDDEVRLQKSLVRLLGDEFKLTCVSDGAEAMVALRGEETFDIILCDLMMPGVDGIELYESLKDSEEDLQSRFIFMTGGVYTDRTQQFVSKLENKLLKKPFSPDFLVNTIRNFNV